MVNKSNKTAAVALAATLFAALVFDAACRLESLLDQPPERGPDSPALESLEQMASDSVTEIPAGGVTAEPSIVVLAVVRDTSEGAALRLEVEVRPVGTAFQGQATAESDPTPNDTAYARVSGLADGTSYHWQARVVDQMESATAWQPYGGNPEHAVDVQIGSPPPPPPPPPGNRLVFTSQPTTTTAGATMPPVRVTLVDAQSNTVTSFTGNVHVDIASSANPAGGTLGGSKDVNAVAGVVTFSDLSITRAGSGYRLEATADGVAPGASETFGINPGPANHPKFVVQPSHTTPNRPITPAVVVEIRDVYGNVATSFTNTVFMDPGPGWTPGATLEGSGRQRAANAGIATFEGLKIDLVGVGYTIVASATNVHAETSAPFDVRPVAGAAPAQRSRRPD